VILYADIITGSMKAAISETERRRTTQLAYNKKHGITPKSIAKEIKDIMEGVENEREKIARTEVALAGQLSYKERMKLAKHKEREMNAAVRELDFETAAILRDEIKLLQSHA